MANPAFQPVLRLVFQGSIPFEDPLAAEQYYEMLKDMVKSASEKSTLNGQVLKMLEPCCGDKAKNIFFPGVSNVSPR